MGVPPPWDGALLQSKHKYQYNMLPYMKYCRLIRWQVLGTQVGFLSNLNAQRTWNPANKKGIQKQTKWERILYCSRVWKSDQHWLGGRGYLWQTASDSLGTMVISCLANIVQGEGENFRPVCREKTTQHLFILHRLACEVWVDSDIFKNSTLNVTYAIVARSHSILLPVRLVW